MLEEHALVDRFLDQSVGEGELWLRAAANGLDQF